MVAGAPFVSPRGDPDFREYLKLSEVEKVTVEQLVRPWPEPGNNPYHCVIVKVDSACGLKLSAWTGVATFVPYRRNRIELQDAP